MSLSSNIAANKIVSKDSILTQNLTIGGQDGRALWTTTRGPNVMPYIDSEYWVFEEAKNLGHEWNTIQGAINGALADGYTPESGRFAKIYILPRTDDTPWLGDENDEILIPFSVTLIAANGSSAFRGPAIKATLIIDNNGSGLAPPTENPLTALAWEFIGLNLIQPSENKPCVICNIDPFQKYVICILSDCLITTSLTTATSALIVLNNFSWLLTVNTRILSLSPIECVKCNDYTSFEAYYCIFLSYNFIKCDGFGTINPLTYLWFNWCEIGIDPVFLGAPSPLPVDNVVFNINSPSMDRIGIWHNNFFIVNTTSPNPITIFKGHTSMGTDPSNTPSMLAFAGNTYFFQPSAIGGDLLYDAPNATLITQNYKTFSGNVTATNVAAILSASSD